MGLPENLIKEIGIKPENGLQNLGYPTAVYRSSQLKHWIYLILGCFALSLQVLLFVLFFDLFSTPRALRDGTLIAVVFPLPIGFYLLWRAWRDWRWRVVVFTEGLAEIRRGNVTTVFWKDIELFWESVTDQYINAAFVGTFRKCRFLSVAGNKFVFDSRLIQIESLITTIREEVSQALYPGMLARFDQGEPVCFGSLTIDRTGIAKKNWLGRTSFIEWKDFRDFNFRKGFLEIYRRNGRQWTKIRSEEIPNLEVFIILIKRNLIG
jgi:hypothetical protein